MSRLGWILLLLSACGVLAVLLLPENEADTSAGADLSAQDAPGTAQPATPPSAGPTADPTQAATPTPAAPPPTSEGRLFLAGRVIDEHTRTGLEGARVSYGGARGTQDARGFGARELLEPARGPRPAQATTGPDGRLRWMVDATWRTDAADCELIVSAPGHATRRVPGPARGQDLDVELSPTVAWRVRVLDAEGNPLPGARVRVDGEGPTEEVSTDAQGLARLRQPVDAPVKLHVEHAAHLPRTLSDAAVSEGAPFDVRLERAMYLTFLLRSDGDLPIAAPVLAWSARGDARRAGRIPLATMATQRDDAALRTQAVALPAEAGALELQIVAAGFSPWTGELEAGVSHQPRTLDVLLTPDASLGSLTLALLDPEGRQLSYDSLGPTPPRVLREGGERAVQPVLRFGEVLRVERLPPGRYVLTRFSLDWLPATVHQEVRAGGTYELQAQLVQAARLRVRFRAAAPRAVSFRLLRDGQPLQAVAEGGSAPQETATALRAGSGDAGALFGGLPAGPCTLELVDPALAPLAQQLELRAGETTEVDLQVAPR